MTSTLPPIPRIVFTLLEPLSLLVGALAPVFDASNFVALQLPSTSPPSSYALTPTNRILVLQLGNMFALTGMVGVGVLYASSEPKVVRNYIIACAVGDIGHLSAIWAVMGSAGVMDVRSWNAMAYGSIGFTAFLLVVRVLYLIGLLGEDRVAGSNREAVKKKQ